MKTIKLEQTYKHKNADNCIATEYDFKDKDIDFDTAKIDGDYPENEWCVNEQVKEMIFVLEGTGTLNFKDEEIEFKQGDAILIEKGEPYCWRNCDCKVAMACSPAWFAEQHKTIKM